MRRILTACLATAALACLAAPAGLAQCRGGGCGGHGAKGSKPGKHTPCGTGHEFDGDYGGWIDWVASSGRRAAAPSGEKEAPAPELAEMALARQDMMPVLLFFSRKDGDAAQAREVAATKHYDKELFGRKAITAFAGEVVPLRIEVGGADPALLSGTYRVQKAPAVLLLDIYGAVLFRLDAPRLAPAVLAKALASAVARVEKQVRILAASDEKTPLAGRARWRVACIEMRDACRKGMALARQGRWQQSRAVFQGVLERKEDNAWRDEARAGLEEVEAGQLYVQAEAAFGARRYGRAKELLAGVMALSGARHYREKAEALLEKLAKRLD